MEVRNRVSCCDKHLMSALGELGLLRRIRSTVARGAAPAMIRRKRCKAYEQQQLNRIVKTASRIIGASLPFLKEIYEQRCTHRAAAIIRDFHHPSHGLFSLLPSGKRYRSISCRTTRMLNSFFAQAVRLEQKRRQRWTGLRLQGKVACLQSADHSVSHSILKNTAIDEEILIFTLRPCPQASGQGHENYVADQV
ncbi:hypothetical protein N1851_013316 [Merluccius polli]|uniref:Uncharacterized protein n=1 Tax=Merluccius polli TaxID=89951 RepID=A0AA47MWB3_MERPO|nr:hypothetical protein N1851_013316 [Merluccius polli]